jgi:hypothetical protein
MTAAKTIYVAYAYGLPCTFSRSQDRSKAVANATRKARKAMRDMAANGDLPWIRVKIEKQRT